jgi:hypothetical protein
LKSGAESPGEPQIMDALLLYQDFTWILLQGLWMYGYGRLLQASIHPGSASIFRKREQSKEAVKT